MPESSRHDRLRVFLACSGLGLVRRGYESFMQACFEALRDDDSIDVHLFKGAGRRTPDETPLRHLPRGGIGARALGEMVGRGPYIIEQVTFTTSLIPHMSRLKPDLVYFCDPAIGKMLAQWRRLTGHTFGLLFHNSGPIPPPFPWCDHVQQVTPVGVEDAINAGHRAGRQTLMPCGLNLGPVRALPSFDDRDALRRRLNLPVDRPIVLSVGALNRGHKRMDYLVSEIAAMPEPRPFLLMLGHVEDETAAVRALATLRLGPSGFAMMTVDADQIPDYYRAADLFVLASMKEGFGLAYVEALAHGLRCIGHDFPVSRYVMGDHGYFADLHRHGALTQAIVSLLAQPDTDDERIRRQRGVRRRFDWSELTPQYIEMFEHAAAAASDAALVAC